MKGKPNKQSKGVMQIIRHTHTHAGMNVEAALCQHMSRQLIRYCKSVWEASKPKEAEKPKIETKTEKPETVDKRQKDRAGQGREWHAIFCVQKTGTSAGGKNWCQHNGAYWSVLEHLGSQTETNNSNRFWLGEGGQLRHGHIWVILFCGFLGRSPMRVA